MDNNSIEKTENNPSSDIIIGRNPVAEALRSGRPIDSLLVAKGERGGSIGKLIFDCREKNIPVKEVDRRKLDAMCGSGNHQGVAAYAAIHDYCDVDDILAVAREKGEAPFIIICDELEDPHNLGAVIRCADAAGAHGIIVPKRRSVPLGFAVGKASAGAIEYVPVARVTNLASTMDELKNQGLWIFGAEPGGQLWTQADYTCPAAIVIGSEGRGIGRLVREKCDFLVSLPMKGNVNSLNASVAAGILMFEVARQRMK